MRSVRLSSVCSTTRLENISYKNLKRVAKEPGGRMTDEELQEMIDEADGMALEDKACPGCMVKPSGVSNPRFQELYNSCLN